MKNIRILDSMIGLNGVAWPGGAIIAIPSVSDAVNLVSSGRAELAADDAVPTHNLDGTEIVVVAPAE